jgi:predicted PurR-regulated permease PerM
MTTSNDARHTIVGSLFALAIVILTALVIQRFFLPLAWAAVFCIATWPLYLKLELALGKRSVVAAALMTLAMACLLVIPFLVGVDQASRQASTLAEWIAVANNQGIAAPAALRRIPFAGNSLYAWWQATLAQPRGLSHLISGGSAAHLHSASEVLRRFGSQLAHRLIDMGFAFLCLFFLYKNGEALHAQIARIGMRGLGQQRFERYASRIPTAIRATVNGLVLVGIGEGILIGIGYSFAGLPSAALWGAATAILAIVPFGAPLVYLAAAGLLAASGSSGAALGVAAWGSLVLMVADHLVRPNIIGSATRLPFLAVLFGILGGVELFGLVGLFLGPVIMVMAITLWREAAAARL